MSDENLLLGFIDTSHDPHPDNEYLRRIHFWVRLWSVLTLLGLGFVLVAAWSISETNKGFVRTSERLR